MLSRIRRTVRALYNQRVQGYPTPEAPHFDNPTLERFKHELSKARLYVEFGSGGSTIAADRQKIKTVSIESDPFYAKAVKNGLSPDTTVKMIVPNIGLTEDWGMPVLNYGRKGERYVSAPFDGSAFPDLILVDGRYRSACALEAARRAKLSGATATLIFDDYDSRPHYHQVEQFLGEPERVGRSAVFIIGEQTVLRDAVAAAAKDPR